MPEQPFRYSLEGAADEIQALQHDIERHIQITTDQQQEIERLRLDLAEVAKDRDIYFKMCGGSVSAPIDREPENG